MINDDNKKGIKKMLKSNALYFALGFVFLAAGIVGVGAAAGKTPTGTADENGTSEKYEYVTQKKEEITENKNRQVEIDIDEFKTDPEAQSEEVSTAAVFDSDTPTVPDGENDEKDEALVFSSPLTLAMGKDYSMGVPVFSETMKDYRTHNGVDFKGVKGENVKTVAKGTVIDVKSDAVWGNSVTIDHGNGIVSCISGLADEALIANGTQVYADTVIGVVGNIPVESSDGAHIHLEMRVNGSLADPLEILGLNGDESQ